MIQRIQTVFLGFIAIAMIIFLFVKIWDKSDASGDQVIQLTASKLSLSIKGNEIQKTATFPLVALATIAFGIATFSIFSFRNRLLQLQLGLALSLVIMVLLGLIVYYSLEGSKMIPTSDRGSFGLGLLIPGFSLILNSLASRFIRSDENAVKSADRLR
jgi:magnesium-transporting ATPase (P-type)